MSGIVTAITDASIPATHQSLHDAASADIAP
jgi:hypothetical protein